MSEAVLFDRFRALWQQTYGVPCSVILSPLDYGKLGIHFATLTMEQVSAALEGYFRTEDAFVTQRRHPLGLFLRDPMRYAVRTEPERNVKQDVFRRDEAENAKHLADLKAHLAKKAVLEGRG